MATVERKAELFVTELLLKVFYIEVTLCSLCLLVVIYHHSLLHGPVVCSILCLYHISAPPKII